MLPSQNACTKLIITKRYQVLFNIVQQVRCHKVWATKRKYKTSIDIALEYFDSVYQPLYGKDWPSMRLALLSPNKYCAIVNNYCDVNKLCTELQNEGAINIRDMLNVQKNALLEKKIANKRQGDLKRVYDRDKKMEQIVSRKKDEELDKIYPAESEKPSPEILANKTDVKNEEINESELIDKAKSPLDQSLLEASIDTNRQIDPSEGYGSSRLNEYVPVSKLKGREDFVSEAEHFSFFQDTKDFPVLVEHEDSLEFPSHLQAYTYIQGDISTFKPAKTGLTGVSGYYLMDGGSLLPVLALGLAPGDSVMDMCAAPGGKSLLCLQTMYPDMLVCNDSSLSRLNRLRYVMQQYFYDWEKKVTLRNGEGTDIQDQNTFDKILVDVPCTNDRHSLIEADNNIFKPSRNKERILLPQLQVDLLFHALKLVKRGGHVVYSTCSLNPAQNDGVVHQAMRKIWEETDMKIVIKDLSRALEPAKVVFRFADYQCLRYGSLVVPYLPSNFGPMYFCKLEKIQ